MERESSTNGRKLTEGLYKIMKLDKAIFHKTFHNGECNLFNSLQVLREQKKYFFTLYEERFPNYRKLDNFLPKKRLKQNVIFSFMYMYLEEIVS